ncbi:hypothetical protein KRP22_006097 [Phytophthora ramorum]|nr:hypothetical protein KRP22_2771 [Phytophthora ramorum]KAH7507672.1 hypothetical protein KRP22_2772 [Phytophthora ramorum]
MRLSCVLLVAAAAFVATLDATSVASGTTLSQLSTANAVGPAKSIGNGRRFLRKHKFVEDDDTDGDEEGEEERGWFASKAVMAKFVLAHATNDMDEMQKILREVRDPDTIKSLYAKVEPTLRSRFSQYEETMGLSRFQDMLDDATGLSDDLKGMLTSAYSKYYAATYL